ncbi:hypothetical protein ES703_54271 [subsurface metagenome]
MAISVSVENWRPLFQKRHRRYAELRAKFGPPLLPYPVHGEVSPKPADKGSGAGPPLSPGGYLELLAKRSVDLDSIFKTKCPGYWIQGSCENGHRYAKELYCGREWCLVCGEEWSATHQRRFSRWISKATQVRTMGYFVFTIPEELRSKFRTKRALSRLGHQVQELLRSYGYSRGLRRFHFFGDKSTKWHPHLNVLVDGGYLSPEKLDLIKAAYAGILGCQVVDVNYRYRRSPGEMVHTLKYVTRATFRDYSWDSRMALELRGFRNQLWWGSRLWDQEPVWSLDDLQGPVKEDLAELDSRAVESLESGICPTCGQPLYWSKVMPISVLEGMEKHALGAGYWELPPVRPPPGWESVKLLRKAGYEGPIRVETVVDLTTGEILLCGN